jgi:maleate isomerase
MSARRGAPFRVGVILPADNVVTEPELYGLGLDGVSFHVARLATEDRDEMRVDALRAAATLALAGVDAVAYACSETSAIAAADAAAFVKAVGEAAGAPAVSATAAIGELLAARSATRVALVTPYRQRYGAEVEQAYRQRGLEVVQAVHHEFRRAAGHAGEWFATNRQSAAAVRRLLRLVDARDADVIVFPATNLPTLASRRMLADVAARPVLTGNQALAWWCLRRGGLDVEAAAVGETQP